MTVAKYWGDEKHKDAVYAIYLKKVRYVPPPGYEGLPHYRPIDPDNYFLTQDIGSDQLQWETIRERVIKAGTVEKLVESLVAPDGKMDSRHFNVFFATYRAFARPDEVVGILSGWFERLEAEHHQKQPTSSVQSTIRSIFICWLDMYPEDFYDHEDHKFPLLCVLIDFAKRNSLLDLKHRARKLRERYRRMAEEGGPAAQLPTIEQYTYALDYDPNDMIYAQERAQMFDISKDNCVQIAEQLTFWDCVLFRELRPYQAQGAIWGRRNKKHANNVYSVRATIDQFNALSQRVMTSIVLPDCRPEFRARIIEKWIEVAKELRALKNFTALKAVISSLQSEPVFRIKSAWACVSKASNMLFRDLTTMFENEEAATTSSDERRSREHADSDSSGGKGAKRIGQCRRTKSDVNLADSQCSVPYLGHFLTDLMMIDQAIPDLTDDGLINFEKRRREFEVMAKIRLYQSAARSYTIPMDHAFCAWFYYLPCMDENFCFQRSMEVEPGANNSTPDLRRNRNNLSATSNGTKMNSITRMFGYLADEISTKSSSLLNGGHFSNDSGIHTEESLAGTSSNNNQNASTNGQSSSAVAMALISRGKMLATPGVSGVLGLPCGTSTPLGGWRASSHSASEFDPQIIQFSPHHAVQSSDPTPERAKEVSARRQPHATSALASTSANGGGSPSVTPSSSTRRQESPALSKQGSFQNTNLNRKMPGHQSTSSHTSTSSVASSISASRQPSSPASNASTIFSNGVPPSVGSNAQSLNFHLARVGLDDKLQSDGPMYKCIKIENGDRMPALIERALEKHMLPVEDKEDYCLVQLLPDGGEFRMPDHCNPFYAVAPDPASPMLNFLLRRKEDERVVAGPSAKRVNKQKRSNLTKWNSGYL